MCVSILLFNVKTVWNVILFSMKWSNTIEWNIMMKEESEDMMKNGNDQWRRQWKDGEARRQ